MSSPAAGRAGFSAALRHAALSLRRSRRAGELRVLALALATAAAVASGVGLFTQRVQGAIERSTGDALGADAVIRSGDPLPAATLQQVRAGVARSLGVVEFPSVVVFGEGTQLSTIKAVEAGYPLRSALSLSDEPYTPAHPAAGIPPRGEVWVDPKLWSGLGLTAGAKLQVGSSTLSATQVIADEPGRGGSFGDFAPELLMNAADLDATGLIGPGSRVTYAQLLSGSDAQLAQIKRIALPRGARYVTPQEARPELKQSMARARQFLDIAVLATLLLAAAAVALSARQYGARLRDEVALLKTLGARRGFLLRSLTLQLLLLGLAAGGVGVIAGAIAQEGLGRIVAPVLNVTLPWPSPWPLLSTLVVVMLMLLGFALPPVAAAVDTPPLRVLQRAATGGGGARLGAIAALLAVAALLWLQAGDARLAGFVAAGALITIAVLALLAWLLVLALRPLRTRTAPRRRRIKMQSAPARSPSSPRPFPGWAWRFGLGNLARRGPSTVAQTVALGVALLSLLLVTLVRQDLLATWRGRLPADAPNQFLVNIQPEQLQPLKDFFAARGYPQLNLLPMVRAHLTAINDQPAAALHFEDAQTQSWINREFNLSWIAQFGADNERVSGEFWTSADAGKPWLSVEDEAAKRLKLKLGDTLGFDIAGQAYTLTVHDTRKVHWDSFKPNFFMMTPPGVLDAPATALRAAAPVQWLTSFYLPSAQRTLLRELVRQFPNITAIDLDASLTQVRTLIDRVVRALELVLLFTLFAGLVVMLAVIEGSRAERFREVGVLRALGASSRAVLQGLLAEYAVLGLLAGLVAAGAAQAIAWTLAVEVFELPYGPRPLLWLIGAGGGSGLVALTGWLGLRSVLRAPPREVLAAST